jgi:hypothetical protein
VSLLAATHSVPAREGPLALSAYQWPFQERRRKPATTITCQTGVRGAIGSTRIPQVARTRLVSPHIEARSADVKRESCEHAGSDLRGDSVSPASFDHIPEWLHEASLEYVINQEAAARRDANCELVEPDARAAHVSLIHSHY